MPLLMKGRGSMAAVEASALDVVDLNPGLSSASKSGGSFFCCFNARN